MSKKLAFILLDGLRADSAFTHMGWLNHLIAYEKGIASTVIAELPTVSRPLYEVILTGQPVSEHNIRTNFSRQPSHCDSLFTLARRNERTTAAAAYYWISELYSQLPFSPDTDMFHSDKDAAIQRGIFYWEDHFPDNHLFAAAHHLMTTDQPDFLFVHSMGIDAAGHAHGGESVGYTKAIIEADVLLAHFIPLWQAEGYDIIVTADHGMTAQGLHNGTSNEERLVPLFVLSALTHTGDQRDRHIPQRLIAPLACHLMDLAPAPHMLSLDPLKDSEGGATCAFLKASR